MLVELVLFLLLLLTYFYLKTTIKWRKYKQRGVPFAQTTWPLGSNHNWKVLLGDGNASESYRCYLGTEFEKEKIFGIIGHLTSTDQDYAWIINDMDIAKRMLIKDFDHFVDRSDLGMNFDTKDEGDMMFSHSFMMQRGDDWKRGRSLMTPVFTTGKLKLMYQLLVKCGEQLEKFVSQCLEQNVEIDSKDTFGKFALDGIATSGVGIESDSFAEPNNMFRKMVMDLMRSPGAESGSTYEMFKVLLAAFFPAITYLVSVPNFGTKGGKFIKDTLLKTIKMRSEGKQRRNDIIDIVLDQLDNDKLDEKAVNNFESEFEEDAALDMSNIKKKVLGKEEALIPNTFLMFGAALDTTSSTLTFAVHFLLKHPDIQERVREEITEVIGTSKKVTFEQIQNLKYLETVILETLRLAHPFANIIERTCTKDYLVPGTNFVVRKGEIVVFSFLYERMKQENDRFYNPTKFDPDNFDPSNNPDTFSFLAFGQGPRNCIGKRYAMISMKIAPVFILRSFRLVKTENTKDQLELFKVQAGAHVPFYAVPLQKEDN